MAKDLLRDIFEKALLIQATFSSPLQKEGASKVMIRPVEIKGERQYQVSEQRGAQVFHRNYSADECLKRVLNDYAPVYKQAFLRTLEGEFQLLTNKKGKTTLVKKGLPKKDLPTALKQAAHNREKNYLIAFDEPFLERLGLSSKGKILPQKMDKFRQINRFLEIVDDTLHHFQEGQKLHLIDFGCGKAYLTFALYHFLSNVKGFDVDMLGLDLKADVIAFCQNLSRELDLKGLHFQMGDIAGFHAEGKVDIMVALHACDTATDAALHKAVRCQAKVILAAPCCQHELYNQVQSEPLESLLQHGILKERFASLATDAARAELLEMEGYKTQILEFIESEHTPKNLAIRAVRGNSQKRRAEAEKKYSKLKAVLSITPALEQFLMK